MINIFVKLCIIIFINVNISVVTPYYLCGKVELNTKYFKKLFIVKFLHYFIELTLLYFLQNNFLKIYLTIFIFYSIIRVIKFLIY